MKESTVTVLPRPAGMFDRHREWAALSRFTLDDQRGAARGVVSGRRRQGKTYLLRALCQATGGFYFAADEATSAESLRSLGTRLAAHLGAPAPLALTDWHDAIDALLAMATERPHPVVIDEFPYLAAAEPGLPSVIQNAFAPLRAEQERSRVRLLLCGSAMSFMGRLLSGNAPLRGRAGLELVVPTLDFRLAADFWGIEDARTALLVHAIVGGTPAYRREFARNDTPDGPDDFDAWVCRTVLSPSSPLFREGRYLLAGETAIRDPALYHSVLAAVTSGNASRGGIASFLGRKSGDLAHALTVLEDCGLLVREADVFHRNRTSFRIAEPLLAFYHAVMRPIWSDLEQADDTARLWLRSRRRFDSGVVGPHVEAVCRLWLRRFAPEDLLAAPVERVGSGTVNDPANRTGHEIDVVAFGPDRADRESVLAIGEVTWGEVMGTGHLDRLAHIRTLLADQSRPGAAEARLLCFGMAGFTEELRARAAAGDALLVGPADLYA